MKWSWFVFALAGLGLAAGPAAAQAVNCANATSAMERMICSNADLVRLDGEMAAIYGDILADGQKAEFDTAAIEREQATWARGRPLCTNVNCLGAYYTRRLETLKAAYVRIHDSSQRAVTPQDSPPANLHTPVGVWSQDESCALVENRLTIQKHMVKFGISPWRETNHEEDDVYKGMPLYYLSDSNTGENFYYDTYVDIITYNRKGLAGGSRERYVRCR